MSLPAIAQQSSAPVQPAGQPPSTLSGNNRQTTINVVVTDKDGKPVSGLEKQDFTLLDNKKPEDISSVQTISAATAAQNPPAEAILLIDTVNTNYVTLSAVRQQFEKFFQQNGGHLPLPVSIVIFSSSGLNAQQGASSDGKVELSFLNQNPIAVHVDISAQGAPGAFDRIERSLGALRSLAASNLNTPGRKLLIWISPGWPIPPESNIGLSPKEKTAVFDRIVAASGLLRVSQTTLYSVDPSGTNAAGGFATNRYKEYLNEIKTAGQAQVGNLALQVFALQSGGRVFVGSNDLSGELTDCIRDASSYYALSFDSPRADHQNEYHRVEVKIDKPGLKARTITSYYIQP
jgi:VWFA-related protein